MMIFRFNTAFFLGMALGCVSGWEATQQGTLILALCVGLNLTIAAASHHLANQRGEDPWTR